MNYTKLKDGWGNTTYEVKIDGEWMKVTGRVQNNPLVTVTAGMLCWGSDKYGMTLWAAPGEFREVK
jgi:hypothetical protein